MVNFGIRQSFDNIEQIEERYSALKAPIEILSYSWSSIGRIGGRI